MFSGKTFKAEKAYKLHLLATLPFPRIWIKIKLNEVQLKTMGKLEWDFFFGTEEVIFRNQANGALASAAGICSLFAEYRMKMK